MTVTTSLHSPSSRAAPCQISAWAKINFATKVLLGNALALCPEPRQGHVCNLIAQGSMGSLVWNYCPGWDCSCACGSQVSVVKVSFTARKWSGTILRLAKILFGDRTPYIWPGTVKLVKLLGGSRPATCLIQENRKHTGLKLTDEHIWSKSTAGSTCKYRLISFQRFKARNSLLSIKCLVVYLAFTVFFFLTYYLCLLKSVYYLFNIKPAANSVCSKTKWEITRLPHHRYMDLYSNGWLLFNCSTAGNHLFCQMCYPMSPRAGNVHHRDSSFEKVIVWITFHTF